MMELNNKLNVTPGVQSYQRQKAGETQLEQRLPVESVKPVQPTAVVDMEKVERVRNELLRHMDWDIDEEGELQIRIFDGEHKLLRSIPAETLQKIYKDIMSGSGRFVDMKV
jgi:uncharacterized FlaG/YvyC family protein